MIVSAIDSSSCSYTWQLRWRVFTRASISFEFPCLAEISQPIEVGPWISVPGRGGCELQEVKTAAYYVHYHTCPPTTNWHTTLSWSFSPHGHALHMLKALNIWLNQWMVWWIDVNRIFFKTNHHLGDCVQAHLFFIPLAWVLVYSVVSEALPLLAVIGPWQSGQDSR